MPQLKKTKEGALAQASKKSVRIGIVDDHKILREGLKKILSGNQEVDSIKYEFEVVMEADNGKGLIEYLNNNKNPDIILLDIIMPEMDGYETATCLKEYYPEVKTLVLTMFNSGEIINHMLMLGVKGFLSKDVEPQKIIEAIHAIINDELYLSDESSKKVIASMYDPKKKQSENVQLSEKEKEALIWLCTDLTYKDIAGKMFVSPRTIDSYVERLCQKLDAQSRTGLVVYAIKSGIVKI